MQKLIIDRQRWLRGEGGGASRLLRESDCKMCCLGFYCIQNGMVPAEILNITSPCELSLPDELPQFLLELLFINDERPSQSLDSEICNLLMNVNDAVVGKSEYATVVDETDREQQIKRLFEDLGVEVEFIN